MSTLENYNNFLPSCIQRMSWRSWGVKPHKFSHCDGNLHKAPSFENISSTAHQVLQWRKRQNLLIAVWFPCRKIIFLFFPNQSKKKARDTYFGCATEWVRHQCKWCTPDIWVNQLKKDFWWSQIDIISFWYCSFIQTLMRSYKWLSSNN